MHHLLRQAPPLLLLLSLPCAPLFGVGCTNTASVRDADALPSRGVVVPTPDRSVFLRASFDDDPSTYVGRFLPDGLEVSSTDENQAVSNRCSEFIKVEQVNASGDYDEYYNSATAAGLTVGVPGIASATAGGGQDATVRVKYSLTAKMRAEITDHAGFEQCCAAASCPSFIVGEFYRGTGSVYQAIGAASTLEAEGVTPEITGELDFKDQVAWRRQTTFDDVYFAFRKQRVSLGGVAAGADDPDCSWAQNVPSSLDGTYFVGIGPPAASEAQARDLAMRNARVQVVKYLGDTITSSMKSKTNAVAGFLEDETVVTSVASGLTTRVKDKRWCAPAQTETPKGVMYSVKVLAYFPKTEESAARSQTIETLAEALKKEGKMTKGLEAELEAAKP